MKSVTKKHSHIGAAWRFGKTQIRCFCVFFVLYQSVSRTFRIISSLETYHINTVKEEGARIEKEEQDHSDFRALSACGCGCGDGTGFAWTA
jgi:hypothetical protein